MKKIFLITQPGGGYDTYSDAIVCAEDKEQAKVINPGGFYKWHDNKWFFQYADGKEREGDDSSWCHPDEVSVKEIGVANDDIELNTVILASFHAG